MYKSTGRKPAQLKTPKLPGELRYLWEAFREVFTGQPLTWQELHSWIQVTNAILDPWEVKAIKELDNIFWHVQRSEEK